MLTRTVPCLVSLLALALVGCGAEDAPTLDEISARAALSADAQLSRGQSRYPLSALDWSFCQDRSQVVDLAASGGAAQRLDLRLTSRGPVELSFSELDSDQAPVALIFDRQGQPIWLGATSVDHSDLTMSPRAAPRLEPSPALGLRADQEVDVVVYLTSWESLLGGLDSTPKGSWTLRVAQDCSSPPEDMGVDLPQDPDLPQEEDMAAPDLPTQEDMDQPDMDNGGDRGESLARLRQDAPLSDQTADPAGELDHSLASLEQCGTWQAQRSFQGQLHAHRYSLALSHAGPVEVALPAGFSLVVTDSQGALLFDGEASRAHPQASATPTQSGLSLSTASGASLRLYVTSTDNLEGGLRQPVPSGQSYTLSLSQRCDVELSSGAALLGQDAALGAGSSDAQVPPARIWRTQGDFAACQASTLTEDFSSGRYNVHRWSSPLSDRGPLLLSLERTAGDWQPALLLVNAQGQVIYQGDGTGGAPGYVVEAGDSGRQGDTASLTLLPQRAEAVYLYVTSWGALDSGLEQGITQQARYRLSVRQPCPPQGDPDQLSTYYAGLSLDGAEIPRAGLSNSTLENTLGVNPEPLGEVVSYQNMDFARGRVSWFGGPSDTGVGPSETGAISGEVLRDLHNPEDPDAATLQARPEDYYFVAMRFSYSPQGRSFWQNARFLIVNPDNGAAVVVRAVDWGPHTNTGRILDLSRQSLDDLGLSTDDEALVSFAPPGTPLGLAPLP